jgi:hypothetical protein
MMLNIAVFAPIPSASTITATLVKAGRFASVRTVIFSSWKNALMIGWLRAVKGRPLLLTRRRLQGFPRQKAQGPKPKALKPKA